MKLHVNVDHVATLRQARGTRYPEPVLAADLCEAAGADGITVHLREDRRHIQDDDVVQLRARVRGVLNLEMAATEEMVAFALRVRPDVVTLVPEKREERTTEGGLDLVRQREPIRSAIERIMAAKIPVSLFIDPSIEAVQASKELGAPRIELHTGDYCEAFEVAPKNADDELARIKDASRMGAQLGLHVAAGHGLHAGNVGPIALLRFVEELNIGHALVARAVFVGMEAAVREMVDAIEAARQP